MRGFITVTCLFLSSGFANAAWKVEKAAKVNAMRNDRIGIVAKLPAKAANDGVSAHLQIECFEHPELTTRTLNLIVSKQSAPGPIGWRYQFDDRPAIERGPFSRISLTMTSLGDSSSEEFKGLATAQRLRVTLLPTKGAQWSFDFDISGAQAAISAVPCKEFKAN
jgi:hypothetical protein